MRKAYLLPLLFLAVVLLAVSFVLVTSDEAEALQYDVKLTYKDGHLGTIRMAKGLNPVFFNYSIQHTGEVLSQETYIDIDYVPPLWQVLFSAGTQAGTRTGTYIEGTPFDILLGRGEVSNLSITITPPLNQLNMTYWFDINVYPRKDVGQNESHRVGVVVPQVAAFEVAVWNPPPAGEYRAIPPSTVTIRFALYNTGNGVDRFLVQGESSRSDAGWTLNFESGLDEYGFTPNISADPNKRNPHFIDVKVPIPAGERAQVTAQITVNATSMFNQTKQMPPAFATIKSLQYYNFQVYINGPDKKDGTPGEQVEFQLKINNLGNGWDTFTIKPVWDAELNPDFIASANPRTIDIDSDTNDTVQYIVRVPTNAPKKTYFFTAEITSFSPELSPVTKSFAVEVGQYFDIGLSSDQPRMATIPGGILDFEVNVKNTGNGLDSIVIKLFGVPEKWLTYIQPPEVSLLQAQESVIQIRVIVPPRFDEAPIGSYNLTVNADSTRSEAEAFFDIQVDITQFYRIEWMYQDEPITDPLSPIAQQGIIKPRRSFNPYEKSSIDITLEIKNFGNGNDNITLSGYSPDPRIKVTVSPVQTLLLRDQTKFVKVTVEVPEDLPAKTKDFTPIIYQLFVNGTSEAQGFEQRVVPLDFEVFNVDALVPETPTFIDPVTQMDVGRPELTVQQGANLSFKLLVRNNGSKPVTKVLVRVFDNYVKEGETIRWNFFNFTTPPIAVRDRYIVGDRPFTADNPPLYWWANKTGSHILEFKVFYDYQESTQNDIATINITVEAPPPEGGGLTESPAFYGAIIAVAIAVIIVAGYVFVLRRKPQVDADLYSSIYGGEFEEEAMAPTEEVVEAEVGAELTPEQQALYGEDYGVEGEEYDYEGEYDYDYDYEDEEYSEEEPQQ